MDNEHLDPEHSDSGYFSEPVAPLVRAKGSDRKKPECSLCPLFTPSASVDSRITPSFSDYMLLTEHDPFLFDQHTISFDSTISSNSAVSNVSFSNDSAVSSDAGFSNNACLSKPTSSPDVPIPPGLPSSSLEPSSVRSDSLLHMSLQSLSLLSVRASPNSSISSGEDSGFLSEDDDGLELELELTQKRQVCVDFVMQKFYATFDKVIATPAAETFRAHGEDQMEETGPSGHGNVGLFQRDLGNGTGGKKRKKADDDDDKTGEEEGGHERTPGKSRPENDSRPRVLFACLFYKSDPVKYHRDGNGACKGPGFPTIHRLKEHLFRYHKLPIHCPRCRKVFRFHSDRDRHLKQENCEVKPNPVFDGLNEDQVTLLKVRKRKNDGRTEEDIWREAYRIIFPEVLPDHIPSPYHEALSPTMIQNFTVRTFTDYLRQDLPSRVCAQIIQRLRDNRENPALAPEFSSEDISPDYDALSDLPQVIAVLPAIVQSAVLKASQQYQQVSGPAESQVEALGMPLLRTQTSSYAPSSPTINIPTRTLPHVEGPNMTVARTTDQEVQMINEAFSTAFEAEDNLANALPIDWAFGLNPTANTLFPLDTRMPVSQVEDA